MASSAQKGSVLLFATVQQNPHLQRVQGGEREQGRMGVRWTRPTCSRFQRVKQKQK